MSDHHAICPGTARTLALADGIMTMRQLASGCLTPFCDACEATNAPLDLPEITSMPHTTYRPDVTTLNFELGVRFKEVAEAYGSGDCPAGRFALKALEKKTP